MELAIWMTVCLAINVAWVWQLAHWLDKRAQLRTQELIATWEMTHRFVVGQDSKLASMDDWLARANERLIAIANRSEPQPQPEPEPEPTPRRGIREPLSPEEIENLYDKVKASY